MDSAADFTIERDEPVGSSVALSTLFDLASWCLQVPIHSAEAGQSLYLLWVP